MRTLSFPYQRGLVDEEMTLQTDIDISDLNSETTELPSTFMEKLNDDIETLEHIDSESEITVTADGLATTTTKSRRNARFTPKKGVDTIHSILSVPTNTMRAYLKSKTGLFLRMSNRGELKGTHHINDSYGKNI